MFCSPHLRAWENPQAPSCTSRVLWATGANLAVGTSHEGLHPTLYPTAHCQGGRLSTMCDEGPPHACQPALWRDLGFLVGFVCFAGYEEAMLSSGDSCCSLWAWVLIQGGGRGVGEAGHTMGAPQRKDFRICSALSSDPMMQIFLPASNAIINLIFSIHEIKCVF